MYTQHLIRSQDQQWTAMHLAWNPSKTIQLIVKSYWQNRTFMRNQVRDTMLGVARTHDESTDFRHNANERQEEKRRKEPG
jgi:hypothetical protein